MILLRYERCAQLCFTMEFSGYRIHIVLSNNFKGKFVAYIEELYNVAEVVDKEEDANAILKPKFEREIERLRAANKPIPKPGTGKAKVSFVANDKIESLRPFIDEFWDKILGTSYLTSFVSNESYFDSWDHYLKGGSNELIEKIKSEYGIDVRELYHLPIHEVLTAIKKKIEDKNQEEFD